MLACISFSFWVKGGAPQLVKFGWQLTLVIARVTTTYDLTIVEWLVNQHLTGGPTLHLVAQMEVGCKKPEFARPFLEEMRRLWAFPISTHAHVTDASHWSRTPREELPDREQNRWFLQDWSMACILFYHILSPIIVAWPL